MQIAEGTANMDAKYGKCVHSKNFGIICSLSRMYLYQTFPEVWDENREGKLPV
jgi:hypothetical protein